MSKHTPGPWRWDRARDQIIAANDSIVCKVATGEDRAEENANAALLAAAPELLESLEQLLPMAEAMAEAVHEVPPKRAIKAKAAIEKALGLL